MPTEERIHRAARVIVESHNLTLVGYLKLILTAVWEENEQFSGKRPLGNSGWQYDVYKAFIKAELIEGKLDEDGCVEECNDREGDELVLAVIQRLGMPDTQYVEEPMHQRMGL